MRDIIFYVGGFDAFAIGTVGMAAAYLTLAGKSSNTFWNRVVPACGYLIGSSFAAGLVTAIARWFGS